MPTTEKPTFEVRTPIAREDLKAGENLCIFVDEGTWYIMVYADCQHLLPNNGCGIYETRPQICREYTTDECEYDNDSGYDQLFETAEQIEEYAEAMLPLKKRSPWSRERAMGLNLPVISG